MPTSATPEPVRSPLLDSLDRIRHGFFTRRGGVSDGIYESLNIGIGSDDDKASVAENRARVAAAIGVSVDRLMSPYQIHSPEVVTVVEPFTGDKPRADAIVTDRPGLAVGVSTADCGPILFADTQAGVVGAAHAGWKGATGGVIESTIAAMEKLGARRARMAAVLGPSISQQNYEVGPEFAERLLGLDSASARYLIPSAKEGHHMFDLNAYTVDRLRAAGVARAEMLGRCTYAEEDLFFSFRRTTHRGEPDYGRQISAIVLEDK
ncbi:MAG: peptidoglycan editing factor PgeF [Methylobacterium mesophilicum]|nr:peptidoglycan editing factor PgeF [Methylobacterium mesophilicum]